MDAAPLKGGPALALAASVVKYRYTLVTTYELDTILGSVNKTVTCGVKKARRNPLEITKHSLVEKVASIGLLTCWESPYGDVEKLSYHRGPLDYNKLASSTAGGSLGLKATNEVAWKASLESPE